MIERIRQTNLFDFSLIHHHYRIGNSKGFRLIVSHIKHRNAQFLL